MIPLSTLFRYARESHPNGLSENDRYEIDSLHQVLAKLQDSFAEFINYDTQPVEKLIKLGDDIATQNILLNNALNAIMLKVAQDHDEFDYTQRYCPSSINLDWIRQIRGDGQITFYEFQESKIQSCFKYELSLFVHQTMFTLLWACLLESILSPDLPQEVFEVECKIADELFYKRGDLYIYKIIVETKDLNVSVPVEERKAIHNTSRLKIVFYDENGKCFIFRLDLPHIGQGEAHINIESENGEKHHINLTNGAFNAIMDTLFVPYINSIQEWNPNGIEYRTSTSDEDPELINSAKINLAMAMVVPYIRGIKIGLDCADFPNRFPHIKESMSLIKHEINLAGLGLTNPDSLLDEDAFDLMDNELSE